MATEAERKAWIDKQIEKEKTLATIKQKREEMEKGISELETKLNTFRAEKETEISELESSIEE